MSAQPSASDPSQTAASPAAPPIAAPVLPAAAAPAPTGHRAAAYFDLDKTILATSSTWALGTPMRRSGLISSRTLAYGLIAQIPYLLVGAGTHRSNSLMEHLALISAGISRHDLMEVVEGSLATAIEPAVYAEALDLIEAHRRAGHDGVDRRHVSSRTKSSHRVRNGPHRRHRSAVGRSGPTRSAPGGRGTGGG